LVVTKEIKNQHMKKIVLVLSLTLLTGTVVVANYSSMSNNVKTEVDDKGKKKKKKAKKKSNAKKKGSCCSSASSCASKKND